MGLSCKRGGEAASYHMWGGVSAAQLWWTEPCWRTERVLKIVTEQRGSQVSGVITEVIEWSRWIFDHPHPLQEIIRWPQSTKSKRGRDPTQRHYRVADSATLSYPSSHLKIPSDKFRVAEHIVVLSRLRCVAWCSQIQHTYSRCSLERHTSLWFNWRWKHTSQRDAIQVKIHLSWCNPDVH